MAAERSVLIFKEWNDWTEAEKTVWAATIIDSDRSIRIQTRDKAVKYFYAIIEVKLSEVNLLGKLQEVLGHGDVAMLHKQRPENKEPVLSWICKDESDICEVLKKVYPYLIRNSRRASGVIEYCSTQDTSRRRELYWELSRDYNHSTTTPLPAPGQKSL